MNKGLTILTKILKDWEHNELEEVQVVDQANEHENSIIDSYDILNEDQRDLAIELLRIVQDIDMNLIIKDDVKSLIKIIESIEIDVKDSKRRLESFLQGINFSERKKLLLNNQFYQKFCL